MARHRLFEGLVGHWVLIGSTPNQVSRGLMLLPKRSLVPSSIMRDLVVLLQDCWDASGFSLVHVLHSRAMHRLMTTRISNFITDVVSNLMGFLVRLGSQFGFTYKLLDTSLRRHCNDCSWGCLMDLKYRQFAVGR